VAHIARVDTTAFRLELKGELQWGKGSRLEALEHVLVRVTTDEGVEGVAEAPARPTIYGETVQSIEAIIRHHLTPGLIGLDLLDEAGSDRVLKSVANNHTARGSLDIALHDARAKSRGSSLWETFSGPNARVRTSFILGMSDLDTMLAEARSIYAQGVQVFKIKVGRNPERDQQVVEALQAEFSGTDVVLYADANEGLAPDTAARDLERLAKLGIAYVEEPLPVERIRERAELRRAQVMPIVADDSCFTLRDLHRELAFDTFDILNIKPARTGYTGSREMLALASEAGKGVMLGSQASAGLGTVHTAIMASDARVTHPSELSFPLKLERDIVEPPLRYENGYVDVRDLRAHRLVLDRLPR
jgi:L-alanine-DL-glutamate epimerase-like enolase superfamily enzyme